MFNLPGSVKIYKANKHDKTCVHFQSYERTITSTFIENFEEEKQTAQNAASGRINGVLTLLSSRSSKQTIQQQQTTKTEGKKHSEQIYSYDNNEHRLLVLVLLSVEEKLIMI